MHHCMPPLKTGWSSWNVAIFPPVMRLVLDDQKQWPLRGLLNKFTSLSWKTAGFQLNQLLSNWASSVRGLDPPIMKTWTCGSSQRIGYRNAWTRFKNFNVARCLSKFWNFFSAQSEWFLVEIGDHGRNLVISLWPGDKATINGVAACWLAPIFWDQDGVFLNDYFPNGQTINAEYYVSLLVQLKYF